MVSNPASVRTIITLRASGLSSLQKLTRYTQSVLLPLMCSFDMVYALNNEMKIHSALIHLCSDYGGRGAQCHLIVSDSHVGEAPRLRFIYQRWLPQILTIEGSSLLFNCNADVRIVLCLALNCIIITLCDLVCTSHFRRFSGACTENPRWCFVYPAGLDDSSFCVSLAGDEEIPGSKVVKAKYTLLQGRLQLDCIEVHG